MSGLFGNGPWIEDFDHGPMNYVAAGVIGFGTVMLYSNANSRQRSQIKKKVKRPEKGPNGEDTFDVTTVGTGNGYAFLDSYGLGHALKLLVLYNGFGLTRRLLFFPMTVPELVEWLLWRNLAYLLSVLAGVLVVSIARIPGIGDVGPSQGFPYRNLFKGEFGDILSGRQFWLTTLWHVRGAAYIIGQLLLAMICIHSPFDGPLAIRAANPERASDAVLPARGVGMTVYLVAATLWPVLVAVIDWLLMLIKSADAHYPQQSSRRQTNFTKFGLWIVYNIVTVVPVALFELFLTWGWVPKLSPFTNVFSWPFVPTLLFTVIGGAITIAIPWIVTATRKEGLSIKDRLDSIDGTSISIPSSVSKRLI